MVSTVDDSFLHTHREQARLRVGYLPTGPKTLDKDTEHLHKDGSRGFEGQQESILQFMCV
jgi:hypothetical protein